MAVVQSCEPLRLMLVDKREFDSGGFERERKHQLTGQSEA